MNDQHPSDPEFNTPAEMLVRAAFLGMLTALAAGILLTIAGLLAAEFKLSLAGIAALVLAFWSRSWLRRHGEMHGAEQALGTIAEDGPPIDDVRGNELLALLREWEALEEKRGTAEFDPWALQALRNDIRRVVESDPALNQLFTELQRAA